MNKKYDYLIVGAGLLGATFAHLACKHGKRCLVIDKRSHLGGNVYCEEMQGIHVHKYGPHIFHTGDDEVWDFVNSFVEFNRFTLNTIACSKGHLYSLPFNMHTFYQMWGVTRIEDAQAIIDRQSKDSGIGNPINLEEQAISLVGKDIYETLIKGYTEKQWGRSCTELPPSIIKRLPVRYTFDNNYFNDKYQGIPDEGYNLLIERLLGGIECRTNCNYLDNKEYFDSLANRIICTGPIDEFFDYSLGSLEYRSLRFEDEIVHSSVYQGNAIINYTDREVPYTRIVEHKFFDINNKEALNSSSTVITREYPIPYSKSVEPYYPISDDKNMQLYNKYIQLAKEKRPDITFSGRLGAYRYLDMDKTIRLAMDIAKQQQWKRN
jgi:UDP-galactopyranose mutase